MSLFCSYEYLSLYKKVENHKMSSEEAASICGTLIPYSDNVFSISSRTWAEDFL